MATAPSSIGRYRDREIVNPLGTCIDVGFGAERLDKIVNGTPPDDALATLRDTVMKIVDSG